MLFFGMLVSFPSDMYPVRVTESYGSSNFLYHPDRCSFPAKRPDQDRSDPGKVLGQAVGTERPSKEGHERGMEAGWAKPAAVYSMPSALSGRSPVPHSYLTYPRDTSFCFDSTLLIDPNSSCFLPECSGVASSGLCHSTIGGEPGMDLTFLPVFVPTDHCYLYFISIKVQMAFLLMTSQSQKPYEVGTADIISIIFHHQQAGVQSVRFSSNIIKKQAIAKFLELSILLF